MIGQAAFGRMLRKSLGQLAHEPSSNLDELNRVREPGAVKIAVPEVVYLRLPLQTTKRGGMDQAPVVDIARFTRVHQQEASSGSVFRAKSYPSLTR